MTYTLHHGDCLDVLATLPDCSVDCCVTSPPYFGLRDYGVEGQIGLEPTPEKFVAKLVAVFREVRRVLRDDGTLWLNIGDSYAGSWGNAGGHNRGSGTQREIKTGSVVKDQLERNGSFVPAAKYGFFDLGVKPKDLIGIPWRVAFALQANGWYLRQDIIWHKPNPMPESVRDRCTKAHEYVFLLSKSARYYFDSDAIQEPSVGKPSGNKSKSWGNNETDVRSDGSGEIETMRGVPWDGKPTRNRRSVWTVPTKPYKGAHFATFPPALIEPCILGGSREGGIVLDPFNGSGTTGEVAIQNGRRYIGIELNAAYLELARARIDAAIKVRSEFLF